MGLNPLRVAQEAVLQARAVVQVQVAAVACAAVALADAGAFHLRNNPVRASEPVFPETAVTRYLAERARDPLPGDGRVPVTCDDPIAAPCRIARLEFFDLARVSVKEAQRH